MLGRGYLGGPMRNDVSDIVVLVRPYSRAGSRYDLLQPESLQLSSLPFPVHEDAVAVPPSLVRRKPGVLRPGFVGM